MKHEFNVKVYPADTDSYGVVWHGAYIKWLERGRIDVLEQMGVIFKELDEIGILIPVIDMNIRFKKFAMPYDELTVETSIDRVDRFKMIFNQEIRKAGNNEIILTAEVAGATTDRNGKLFRTLPEHITSRLLK